MGCSDWITPTRRILLLIAASRPLSGMPTIHPAEDAALPVPGRYTTWCTPSAPSHQPANSTDTCHDHWPVTPDGARESGQPWWLAALGTGSRVRQPQSGTTLLPLCLQGPSD